MNGRTDESKFQFPFWLSFLVSLLLVYRAQKEMELSLSKEGRKKEGKKEEEEETWWSIYKYTEKERERIDSLTDGMGWDERRRRRRRRRRGEKEASTAAPSLLMLNRREAQEEQEKIDSLIGKDVHKGSKGTGAGRRRRQWLQQRRWWWWQHK